MEEITEAISENHVLNDSSDWILPSEFSLPK